MAAASRSGPATVIAIWWQRRAGRQGGIAGKYWAGMPPQKARIDRVFLPVRRSRYLQASPCPLASGPVADARFSRRTAFDGVWGDGIMEVSLLHEGYLGSSR